MLHPVERIGSEMTWLKQDVQTSNIARHVITLHTSEKSNHQFETMYKLRQKEVAKH